MLHVASLADPKNIDNLYDKNFMERWNHVGLILPTIALPVLLCILSIVIYLVIRYKSRFDPLINVTINSKGQKSMTRTPEQKDRIEDLLEKVKAHKADTKNPALTPDEKSELADLQAIPE